MQIIAVLKRSRQIAFIGERNFEIPLIKRNFKISGRQVQVVRFRFRPSGSGSGSLNLNLNLTILKFFRFRFRFSRQVQVQVRVQVQVLGSKISSPPLQSPASVPEI